MTTEIILLRHGETDYNQKRVYCGHNNPGINENGVRQLEARGEFFKEREKIDKIYCSDLQRCQDSANIVTRHFKAEMEIRSGLREIKFGIFEGRGYDEIKELYPEESRKFVEEWDTFKIPQGESLQELKERVLKEMDDIVENNKGKTVLVSTHGGVVQMLLSQYLCKNLEGYWRFSVVNGGTAKLIFSDGFVYLKYLD